MVQQLSEVSKQQLSQQLAQTLGQTLSEQELSNCCKQIEILEPSAGKRFWQAADAIAGIYIILAGKVRLLECASPTLRDRTDNLIASVSAGASFGELTLFPDEQFQPYAARASVNLKLCYIPADCLRSLICKYPSIEQHLHQQAVVWDLLLFCRQNAILCQTPVDGLMKTLSLLERHNLEVGKFPTSLLKEGQLWLVRQGELLHSSGQRLTAGNIYIPSQLPQGKAWQVTQPTELYSLNRSDWETALSYLPQLAELTESQYISASDIHLSELPPTPIPPACGTLLTKGGRWLCSPLFKGGKGGSIYQKV